MKKEKKSSSIIKKITIMGILLVIISGMAVFAMKTDLRGVKIELQNGYELTALTNKTKVADILAENNIVLKEDEKTIPAMEDELNEKDTSIKVLNKTEQEIQVATISEQGAEISIDELLQSYAPITEKIVVEQEEIPFETITKTATEESEDTTSKVLQEGENGVKETTYKVKYQNEQEIEKTLLSEEVIKEPVSKIVQVQKKVTVPTVTSRSSTTSRSSVVSGGAWSYTTDEFDLLCAITAQEAGSSYQASLAVITCAANRAESSTWRSKGTDPLSQYKAAGQFCYSIDSNWKRKLNGNYPSFVSQAVTDALNGTRNHNYLSFRSASSGTFGENIGGNVYFNPMK